MTLQEWFLVSVSSELLTFVKRKTKLLDQQLSKINVVPSFLFIKNKTKCYTKGYASLLINNSEIIKVYKEVCIMILSKKLYVKGYYKLILLCIIKG